MADFFTSLTRRKTIGDEPNKLARCLTLTDLTALGVGSTLGLGVYVLAGSVAKSVAGPAVCLSFFVAAFASAIAGLCYAEFASRVPRAGSAYVYSYVTVGEIVAYIIGWNLILEYVLGTASVARGLSNYIDALSDYKVSGEQSTWVQLHIQYLAPYLDFLSLAFIILLTVLLSIGVKESTSLNNLFTALNLTVIGVVLVSGCIKADPSNWTIPKDKVPKHAGDGGFMPFGISGVMAGAAKCFFGFVGFDGIATTGEEAKNPKRDIPLAIIISLIIIFFAYFGISTVLTMMLPYFEQDANAPFPYVFDRIGWHAIKWIVTIGAVCALCTSLLGCMFPLPRVIYAMSKDGLIFKSLSYVNPKTRTPLIATILSGVLSGIMAVMFDVDQLIDMMSIGTLLAYTIVAVSVLILRYQPSDKDVQYPDIEMKHEQIDPQRTVYNFFKLIFNLNLNKYPNELTTVVTNWSIGFFSILSAAFCSCVIYGTHLFDNPFFIILFTIIVLLMIVLMVAIARQPVDDIELAFKVPWVPLMPCISVIINIYLMLELSHETWIRFIVWLAVGFLIYFFYGIKNSEEKKLNDNNKIIKYPTNSDSSQDTKF